MSTQIKWMVAVALAILTGFSAWMWTRQYESDLRSARFLKLKDDVGLIRDATTLEDSMIEIAELPERFAGSLRNVAVPAEPNTYRLALLGRRAVQDVASGSLLLFQHFEPESGRDLSDHIAPGMRALTVAVNAESTVGFFVRPGSRVDLIGTFVEPAAGQTLDARLNMQTRVLLHNVKVLAVGSARTFTEYQRMGNSGYNTVTLELTPKQANVVTFAQQQLSGPLTMVLRRLDEPDDAEETIPFVDWEAFSGEAPED